MKKLKKSQKIKNNYKIKERIATTKVDLQISSLKLDALISALIKCTGTEKNIEDKILKLQTSA